MLEKMSLRDSPSERVLEVFVWFLPQLAPCTFSFAHFALYIPNTLRHMREYDYMKDSMSVSSQSLNIGWRKLSQRNADFGQVLYLLKQFKAKPTTPVPYIRMCPVDVPPI